MVVSNIFCVHLYLGKIPILTHIFSNGLVQPPTSHAMPPTKKTEVCSDSQKCVSKTCDEQSRCFLVTPSLAVFSLGNSWETLKETPRYSGIFYKCIWGIHPFLRGFFNIFHVSFLGVYVSQLVDGCLKSRFVLQKDVCFFNPQKKHTIGMQHIYTLFEYVYFCHLLTSCDFKWDEYSAPLHSAWLVWLLGTKRPEIFVAWIFSWGAKRIASYAWQIMMIPARPEFWGNKNMRFWEQGEVYYNSTLYKECKRITSGLKDSNIFWRRTLT